MKKINIYINPSSLALTSEQILELNKIGPHRLFENYLSYALQSQAGGGLKGVHARIYAKLLERLDNTLDSVSVDFEDAEFELIEKAFFDEQVAWQPGQIRALAAYQKAIIDAKG